MLPAREIRGQRAVMRHDEDADTSLADRGANCRATRLLRRPPERMAKGNHYRDPQRAEPSRPLCSYSASRPSLWLLSALVETVAWATCCPLRNDMRARLANPGSSLNRSEIFLKSWLTIGVYGCEMRSADDRVRPLQAPSSSPRTAFALKTFCYCDLFAGTRLGAWPAFPG
jgi:hypothetical protein